MRPPTLLILIMVAWLSANCDAQPAPRMSITEFVKDAGRVAALKRGVKTMKARDPSDPTSWFYQAAVHAVTAEAIAEAAVLDPNVNNVDQAKFWNQCPHFGAPSADFLLWHRAYLYYFERVLRDAAGEPDLSLPYWNYSGAERTFPELYGDAEEDAQGVPTNPLYEERRELAFVFGLYELSDRVVTTTRIFGEKRFFGPTDFEGFAGGVADSDPSTKGLIERQPHDLMHFAIGGAIGAEGGAMSSVPTAAFDAVFWAHHANIDHLWSQWDALPDRDWGSIPSMEWFHSKPWYFNDADGSVVNLPRYHYLRYQQLGVVYDDDDLTKPRLTDKLPTGVGESAIELAARGIIAQTVKDTKLSASRPVALPLDIDATGTTPEDIRALVAKPRSMKSRAVIEIDYTVQDAPPNVGFDVFLVAPNEEIADLKEGSTSHLGTLNVFGANHQHQMKGAHGDAHDRAPHQATTQTFDITNRVEERDFNPSAASIVLKPFDLFKRLKKEIPLVRRSGGIVIHETRVRIR